jgi:hypothetical protein
MARTADRKRARFLGTIPVAALVAAACGGGDEEAGPGRRCSGLK